MKPALLSLFSFLLWSQSAYSQAATPIVTADETGYFVSFFERIGSADVSPALLIKYEAAVQRMLDLDAAESALLHSSAQSYRTMMTQLRKSESAVTGFSVAQLVQNRDQGVANFAATLLNSVRPQTAARLRAEAQSTTISRKGGH